MDIKTSGKWRPIEPMDELREHPRFRVDARADVHGQASWLDHPITNLSVGGICVTVDQPSPVGARVRITLRATAGQSDLELEGVVKWASATSMGLEWTCGADDPGVRRYLSATRIEVVPDDRDP